MAPPPPPPTLHFPSGVRKPKESRRRVPGDRIRANMDRDHTRRSDPGHRPASIVELADRALKNPWDPSTDLRFWMKAAANHRLAGKSHAETGNLEGAFVEYAQAATLILEKLPSHPEYWSSLNAEQRHNLGLNGQATLDELSELKPTIVMRHERWLAQHPEADSVLSDSGTSSLENRRKGFGVEQPHSVQHPDYSYHPPPPEGPNVDGYAERDNVQIFDQTQTIFRVEATLDHALSTFELEVPLRGPQAWVEQNSDYIDRIARAVDLAVATGIEVAFSKLVNRNMIYKRLIFYAFAHLKLCSRETELVMELQEVCDQWKSLDNVALLSQHRRIKDTLGVIIQKVLRSSSHTPEALSGLMKLEVISLCAHLTNVLEDSREHKRLMILDNSQDAQSILDLIQMCLELPLDPSIKRLHFRTLVKMSRTYGLYPNCLVLQGIEMNAFVPEAAGAYGDIYKGKFRGKTLALKVLRVYQRSDLHALLKGFSAEAAIWRQLDHPNVSPFYGIYHLEDTRICFASPWMENGNIVEFLKSHPNTKRFPLVMDIARGLEYLHGHEPSIIHADLKGVNILVTLAQRACLADFGLATVKDSKRLTLTASTQKSVGTIRWQAPELLDPSQGPVPNTKSSDIYAFSCVCYEVYTGQLPFYEFEHEFPVMFAVAQGQRPSRPAIDSNGLDNDVWCLIEACWDHNPSRRPTAKHAIERLLELPNFTQDRRSNDVFDNPFSSQILYPRADHPVPAHQLSGKHMEMLRAWKSKNTAAQRATNVSSLAKPGGSRPTVTPPPYRTQRLPTPTSVRFPERGDQDEAVTPKPMPPTTSTSDLPALDGLVLGDDPESLKSSPSHSDFVGKTTAEYYKSQLDARVRARTISTSGKASMSLYESLRHLKPAIPALPQGPSTTAQVMNALRVAHGHYLSTMGLFIGYAHSHPRSSLASAADKIHKLFDEIIDMVCIVLTISDSVARSEHTVPETAKLNVAKDGLFRMATALGEAVRALDNEPSVNGSDQDDKIRLLTSATDALKAGAECVKAVRICLHTTITDKPFSIDIPISGEPNAWHRHAIIQTYTSDGTQQFF